MDSDDTAIHIDGLLSDKNDFPLKELHAVAVFNEGDEKLITTMLQKLKYARDVMLNCWLTN